MSTKYKLVLRPDTSVPETGLRTLNGVAIQPVIDSSGNIEMSGNYLLVKNIQAGTESFTTNGEIGIINVFSDSTTNGVSCINFKHNRNNMGGNTRRYCSFQPRNTNFIAGSITGNPATVSYNTMSDRRVKTNITSIDNENKYRSNNNNDISYSWLESVNALTPYIYSFNTDYVGDNNGDFTYKHSIDANDISVNYQGFIADEVQQVYPPAVQGISGEVENNGTPVYQQLDMTKLIPMMVGAIKDLSSKVSTLEAYINDINGERISPNIKYTSTNGMFYYTINNTNTSYDLDDYYKPIKDAIEKWDSLIGIPSIYTTTNNLNYTILNITINFSELESNVLGGAFVTHITSPGENTTNTYGNTFATNGVFNLNTLYLSQMKDNIYDNGLSQLYYTSLHEIGHILGIGPFWVLTDNISSIPRTAYQENGETKYYYTGINALQQYKDYFPDNISKDYIGIPLEDNGGSGTQNVHPEEGFVGDISTETRDISGITYYGLNDELMTGWSESSNIMPLSRVTLGFLEDIGYNVNYSLADDYQATYPIN